MAATRRADLRLAWLWMAGNKLDQNTLYGDLEHCVNSVKMSLQTLICDLGHYHPFLLKQVQWSKMTPKKYLFILGGVIGPPANP